MSQRIARNGFSIIKIGDEPLPEDRPKFIVDGIVAKSLTLLYGQPKHGKSTLAMALAVAVANGYETFLGRKVNLDGPVKVGIIAGDPEDDSEYDRVIAGTVPADDGVHVYCFARPPQPEHWQEALTELRHWGAQLVIIDNLQSFCRDVNESRMISPILDRCDQLMRTGVAVVLVHHVSEKSGPGGPSTTPMGHTSISAAARWKVRTYLPGNGPLKLTCEGNYGPMHEILLSRPDGTLRFDVLGAADAEQITERRAQRKAVRDKTKLDRNAAIAAFWRTNCHGMNYDEASAKIAAEFGGKASTHRSQISRVYSKIPADAAA